MTRIGFWGPLYYNYSKEPTKEFWYLFRALSYCVWAVPNSLPHVRNRRLRPDGKSRLCVYTHAYVYMYVHV